MSLAIFDFITKIRLVKQGEQPSMSYWIIDTDSENDVNINALNDCVDFRTMTHIWDFWIELWLCSPDKHFERNTGILNKIIVLFLLYIFFDLKTFVSWYVTFLNDTIKEYRRTISIQLLFLICTTVQQIFFTYLALAICIIMWIFIFIDWCCFC